MAEAADSTAVRPVNEAAGGRIKMKELEARTRVGREAIRFYIREGMLPEPRKPKRNVAYYSEDHVRRLLAIRHLREEREMSLARIKHLLQSSDFDTLTGDPSLRGMERLLPVLVDGVLPGPDRPLTEILAEGNVTRAEYEELCAEGVIGPLERDADTWINFRDAAILSKWGTLRKLGFTAERGYEVGTLLRYHKLAGELAAFEVDQFLAAFSGVVGPEDAADAAARGLREANDIIAQMHLKAVLEVLSQRLSR